MRSTLPSSKFLVIVAWGVMLFCAIGARAQVAIRDPDGSSDAPIGAEELKSRLREGHREADVALVQSAARGIMSSTSGRESIDLFDAATIEAVGKLEVVMRKYAGEATSFVPPIGDPDPARIRDDLQKLIDASVAPREGALFEAPSTARVEMLSDAVDLLERLEIAEDIQERVEIAETVLIRIGRDHTVTQRLWRKSRVPIFSDVTRGEMPSVESARDVPNPGNEESRQ
jgi:hypothetical protein